MDIFVYLHMAYPVHCAGSETTVHTAMAEMVRRGHKVTMYCDQTPHPYETEGIQVLAPTGYGHQQERIREIARGYDLLITHLDLTRPAMQLSIDLKKPLVHFVHNSMQFKFHNVTPEKCQLAVFNSHWVAEAEEWPGPQVTIHPIVEPHRYVCERGTKITLCNPTYGKGIETVHKVSELMPDREFLIVLGIYGEQIAPPNLSDEWVKAHSNIEHMDNTPDVREVFRKTKVLLMPSGYESYGRVAVEAACAGIPTICHPTPGLKESLGDAGIFRDRDDITAWRDEIDRLCTDEVYYRKRSDLAFKLADNLDPESEFDRLEEALLFTMANWSQREEFMMDNVALSNRRLGKTKDGKLTDNMADAISLVAGGPDQPIPEEFREQAEMMGFVQKRTEVTEPLLDTKALRHPPENKAVEAPQEIKGKKTARKKKIA